MNNWQKCPVCDGRGIILYFVHTQGCNVCNGHGIISVISGKPPQGPSPTATLSSSTTDFIINKTVKP